MIVALVSVACFGQSAPIGDVESAQALEAQIQKTRAAILPTCVGLEILDATGPSTGSGTIISADGWILTAGHVCSMPGLDVTVYFSDGTTTTGKTAGLHWSDTEDCGLVRFDPTGHEVVVAELGAMQTVSVGDWVLALGHTFGIERDPFRPPVLRLGRATDIHGAVMHMDAPLSSGDSGGGVFDLQGRLIGINSTAGPEPEINTATTIDFAKSRLRELKESSVEGEHAKAAQDGSRADRGAHRVIDMTLPREDAPRKSDPKIIAAISPVVDNASMMTVGVFVDGRLVSFGTVADSQGLIIAKASEVGNTSANLMVALPDGLTVAGQRVAVDSQLDLVLIETTEALEEPNFETVESPAVGAILVTVGRDGSAAAYGVRSLDSYQPTRSDVSASFLGARARPATEEERASQGGLTGVILVAVEPTAPAARATLRIGDFVTRIAGESLLTHRQLGEIVRRHAVGEIIEVVRMNGGVEEVLRVRLAARPREHGPSPSTPRFPASRRSSGFGPVIQHDSALRADQMGGPLVDLNGAVIGVNIARADRTKTYALSSATVTAAIAKLMAEAKERGGPLPLTNSLEDGIVTLQSGAVIRLDARSAEIVGSTLHLTQVEDTPAMLDRWIDANDSARWLVEFTESGDYAVKVVQGCAAACAGQEFVVALGETTLRGKSKATADWTDFQEVEIGSIRVESPGRAIIEMKTGGQLRAPLLNLHAIELKRTPSR